MTSHPSSGRAFTSACHTLGVDTAFLVPGRDVSSLVDGLRQDPRIRSVPLPDEGCAVAMADGWARRTGRPALVIAGAGPGATALAPMLSQAHGAGVPLLVVTAGRGLDRGGAGWSGDDVALLRAAGCTSFIVAASDDASAITREVGAVLGDGRIVHVAIDPDAGHEPVATTPPPATGRSWAARCPAPTGRTVLLVGPGAVGRAHDLRALAAGHGLPVVTDAAARGVIDEDAPLALGHVGHGASTAATAALGPDPRHRADRVVQLGPTSSSRAAARGCAGTVEEIAARDLDAWLEAASSWPRPDAAELTERAAWVAGLLALPPASTVAPVRRRAAGPDHSAVVRAVAAEVRDGTVLVADAGGFHTAVATEVVARRPRTVLMTGALTVMGWGLRAAMGAALADPDVDVVAFVGDGDLHVAGTDLAVAARHRLRLLVVVAENGVLGSARAQHRPGPGDPAPLPPLDPVGLAAACGVPAERWRDVDGVRTAVRTWLGVPVTERGPQLLAVRMPAPGPDERPRRGPGTDRPAAARAVVG